MYRTWLRAVPPDEYVARSLKRQQRFQDLSRRTRRVGRRAVQRLATPADHERPSTPDVEQAALLPDGAATRDAAFLARQGNLLDGAEHREAAG